MPLLFAIPLTILILAAATTLLWLIRRSLLEQSIIRRTLDISMLQVTLPKDIKPEEQEGEVGQDIKDKISVGEQWLSTLSNLQTNFFDKLIYGRPIVALEIVARNDGVIVFYAGTERRFLAHLEKQIYAFYPDADVSLSLDYTIFAPNDAVRAARIKLKKDQHLPIATYRELKADPMQSITGALAKIQNGDAAVIQFLCRPTTGRSRKKGQKAARRTFGGGQQDVSQRRNIFRLRPRQQKSSGESAAADPQRLTPRAQERVELVETKASQAQFDVNIRLGVATRDINEAEQVYGAVISAFSQYDLPDLNHLGATKVTKSSKFVRDLIFRIPRKKSSSTFSIAELASLYHFPLPTTATPNILWRGAKVAPMPSGAPTKGILLGQNIYRGIAKPIHLALDDRRRHLYLIGQTGTGKTTLFHNMITQDIAAGHGVAVVDPHSDLIENILLHIPEHRIQDVILFDPRDIERPLGFNILESKDPAQKDMIVNEVVQILQKLAARLNPESIGPMFEHYLRNALLALVEDSSATLIDVPRMFVDEQFRKRILSNNPDPTVMQFWEKEFAQSQKGQLSADMLSYVISKLGRFISNSVIRNLIGQPKSSFDVREIMDQKKILLCNFSKGNLGDINADLLGFLLVSKIQIAALGRANVPEEQRPDFYMYLDEFQNFSTDSIVTILSEARKYRLNLNLTHQFIQQLDDPIKEAVFGNVGTIISYRIGVEDAEFMAQQFAPVFTDYDLTNLERFTAVIRLLVKGTPLRPFSLVVDPPPVAGNVDIREKVRGYSRRQYGRVRADVEGQILERFKFGDQKKEPPADAGDYMSESLFDVN